MTISAVFTMRGRPYYFDALERLQSADEIIPAVDDFYNKREHITVWNDAFAHAKGDVLLICGERMIFFWDWREKLEKKVKQIKSGVVSFWEGKTVAAGAVTRDFYEKELNGNMWSPDYIHYYADVELGHKASALNKYHELLNIIEHKHGKTDGVSQSIKAWDEQVFNLRGSKGFPNERLITDENRNAMLKVC